MNVFGVYLDNFQFGPLLYFGIAAVLLALCWLGWRRSAVGKAQRTIQDVAKTQETEGRFLCFCLLL